VIKLVEWDTTESYIRAPFSASAARTAFDAPAIGAPLTKVEAIAAMVRRAVVKRIFIGEGFLMKIGLSGSQYSIREYLEEIKDGFCLEPQVH
jgi:hypothetical protein